MSRIKRRARKAARDAGFVFEAEPRTRMHYGYDSITVNWGTAGQNTRWWLYKPRVWVEDYRADPRWKDGVSSHARCRTLRAFRSHLRRHRAELAGCEVVLVSRYIGHNVTVQL